MNVTCLGECARPGRIQLMVCLPPNLSIYLFWNSLSFLDTIHVGSFILEEACQCLEGWFSCQELLLLLHRAQVWFQAPTSGCSHLPESTLRGSEALFSHNCTSPQTDTHIHVIKDETSLFLLNKGSHYQKTQQVIMQRSMGCLGPSPNTCIRQYNS